MRMKLFGVILVERGRGDDEEEVMRKSASMGNLASCATFAAAPNQGYLSDVGPIGGSRRPRGGERKRGIPWTEEEHKTFLAGLKKHGKGDWRGISRDYVPTRTPTQVASHAQKYFLRHSNPNKKKRRCSLFDVVIDETVRRLLPKEAEDDTTKEKYKQKQCKSSNRPNACATNICACADAHMRVHHVQMHAHL